MIAAEFVDQNIASQHTPTGEERRQMLVDAAYDVIATKGFEGLRVREVAARGGVNVATLHYYFPTKEALVRAVVEHVMHRFRALASVRMAQAGTALEQIQRSLIDQEHLLRTAPEMFSVLMELELRSLRDPVMHVLLQETSAEWHAHVAQILRDGVHQGVFRADLDIVEAASMWIALLKGVTIQEICQLDKFDFTRLGALWECWLGNTASGCDSGHGAVLQSDIGLDKGHSECASRVD